ncbi:MAG: hypothetical protein LJE68_16475 [Rhodobacter sp.]|nr:hypothetical protein [Rhodobacter sp.]
MCWKRCALIILPICAGTGPAIGNAEQVSLFQKASFLADREPLFDISRSAAENRNPRQMASLFVGQSGASFFTPLPDRLARHPDPAMPGKPATQTERIRHLIARAEAGKHGYDAIQHGARKLPAKPPTQMTIAEIYDWIVQTPGQQHAIGRYQFIPATLRRLVAIQGIGTDTVFAPRVQDQLADVLLRDAGLADFARGEIGRYDFMNNLARIWAGLPTSSGQSYYHGLAGNRATMTWAYFDREMEKIFPG